jgi:hypothetical protein
MITDFGWILIHLSVILGFGAFISNSLACTWNPVDCSNPIFATDFYSNLQLLFNHMAVAYSLYLFTQAICLDVDTGVLQ